MSLTINQRLYATYYCLTYNYVRDQIRTIEYTPRSQQPGEGTSASHSGSVVERAAIRLIPYRKRIEKIETAVMYACKGDMALYPYILKGVTDEFETCDHLVLQGMPLCRNSYYKKKKAVYNAIVQMTVYDIPLQHYKLDIK